MKVVGSLQAYDKKSGGVRLTQDIMLAVAAGAGTQLYCLGLFARSHKTPLAPDLTVLAAPFPTKAWPDLVRASISLPPSPGAISTLHLELGQLGLICRYLEMTDGLNLADIQIQQQKEDIYIQPESKLVLSTTFVILEIQETVLVDLGRALRRLQESIASPGGTTPRSQAESLLQRYLTSAYGERGSSEQTPRVEWVSPMLTLNALSKHWQVYTMVPSSRPESEHKQVIRRIRKKTVAGNIEGSNDALLDVSPWTEQLPDVGKYAIPQYVVTTFSDSDDRYIACQFHRLKNRIIVEMTVEHERGVQNYEHRQAVLTAISHAQGNIVAGYSSSRLDRGKREFVMLVVHFPYLSTALERGEERGKMIDNPSLRASVIALLDCLRKMIPQRKSSSQNNEAGMTPTLIDAVAYGPSLVEEDYIHPDWFKENPYNYTLPMTRARYERTFSASNTVFHSRTSLASRGMRMSLAHSIQKLLTAEQRNNVALVGAHRLGKTSTLRLIHDYILEYSLQGIESLEGTMAVREGSSAPHRGVDFRAFFIPINLNASLTPPHLIANNVASELNSLILRIRSKKGISEYLGRAFSTQTIDYLVEKIGQVQKFFNSLESKFREQAGGKFEVSTADQGYGKITTGVALSPEIRQEDRLRRQTKFGLEQLQQALNDALAKFPNFKLIILVDEVAEGLTWGGHAALAAWRYILESDHFSALRWLIATTRPINTDIPYSPVSNVFREYNLSALVEEEANELLDQMESAADDKLAPIVTPRARNLFLRATGRLPYLMQVAGVHVFEAATSGQAPLVTHELVMHVLRSKVIVELSEYFEGEWRRLGDAGREEIHLVLSAMFVNCLPLASYAEINVEDGDHHLKMASFSPATRRSLDRSGLNGAYQQDVVVLLFSEWLYSKAAVATKG